jgi:hypothetical protein
MKTNIVYQFLVCLTLILATLACDEDGKHVYLTGLEANQLTATSDQVVLTQDHAQQIVLSLVWNAATLAVSDPNMDAPNVLSNYLQISTQANFAGNVVESQEKNLSKAFNGAELNTVAKNLLLAPHVATTVFFRLRASIANNMEPAYSNTVSVQVTPYSIDMSTGFLLDADKNQTAYTLASTLSDGVYTGFVGAAGWQNFFLQEGDGTVWGNIPQDETEFQLTSTDPWNCWFPGTAGCYFVTVNTVQKNWEALLLQSLTVSGDISATMTFDRANVQWTATVNVTTPATLYVQLSATGKQYNVETKTNDDLAVEMPVYFAQEEGGLLAFAKQESNIRVEVAAAGEYTLVVDLRKANEWTCKAEKGAVAPVEVLPFLYLPGIDDGITGEWTFDNSIALYHEEQLAYAGVVNVNSLWGYAIHTEKNNWDDKYTLGDDGDAYKGNLTFKGDNNIPAPDPGLYLIDASIQTLDYQLVPVGSQIYLSGLNDIWDFTTTLHATNDTGVYTGEVAVAHPSEWGFTVHLQTDDWDHKFGGSNGTLYYKGNNITDDATLDPGTYTVTVDLIQGTYTVTQ